MATKKEGAKKALDMSDEELIKDIKKNMPDAYKALSEFFEDKYLVKIMKIIAWDVVNETATHLSLQTENGDVKHIMSYFGD